MLRLEDRTNPSFSVLGTLGTAAAGGVGTYINDFEPNALNNRGDVSFLAALETGESGVYVYSSGSLHVIARTGTVIPGVGAIASFGDMVVGGALNDHGQVFFWAMLTDGSGVLLLAPP